MGLVRLAVEAAGCDVVWANDIDRVKGRLYESRFGTGDFELEDIRQVHGSQLPPVTLATASFPCVDLSLAGNRRGLHGEESGMFWEFARVLEEMDAARPPVVMLENVPAFATSNGGNDLRRAIARLNALGYVCDLLVIDARHFVPQSRPRLFIVGAVERHHEMASWGPSALRPPWIQRFVESNPDLRVACYPLSLRPHEVRTLTSVVERLSATDPRWWDERRAQRFQDELSPLNAEWLAAARQRRVPTWATAYRRTRHGRPMWEIRKDGIAGCLRTARGGSSKQALLEAGRGEVRVRWMMAREYARLQGVPETYSLDAVTETQALFGLGDAVCVPAVAWLAREYLTPLIEGAVAEEGEPLAARVG